MSMDSIDDLEAAEDRLREWQTVVCAALANDGNGSHQLRAVQRQRLVKLAAAPYCRPTCDTHGERHEVLEGSFTRPDGSVGTTYDTGASCGCPCHG